MWSRTYGGSATDWCYCGQPTEDGGYILGGKTSSLGTDDVYLVKTDAEGVLLWERIFGGDCEELAYDLKQTRDGGFILAGKLAYYQGGNPDMHVIRTDENGFEAWTLMMGMEPYYEVVNGIQQTADDGFILACTSYNPILFNYDAALIRLDGDYLAVSEPAVNIPATFEVNAHPNPFNPLTSIQYSLKKADQVNLTVYDLSGCKVTELLDGHQSTGTHEVTFNAVDLPSGVYIYRFASGQVIKTGKLILMK
jgi:hypothetical protein